MRIEDSPSPTWLDTWHAVDGTPGPHRVIAATLLAAVDDPTAYVSVVEGGQVIAVGRGVAHDGWLGIYNMATVMAHRGRGLGEVVLRALAHWSVGEGAGRAYLAVLEDNAPARRLYARCGFTPAYRYWYRTKAG